MVRIASTSSASFIEPIWAAKAEPGAAGDHDRGHQHAQFLHRRAADQVDRVDFGAELAELDRALLGDDDADEEAHQPDDAERLDADHLELLGDRVQPEAARTADDIPIVISSAPKKPSRPSSVRPAIIIEAPIWPSTRWSGNS